MTSWYPVRAIAHRGRLRRKWWRIMDPLGMNPFAILTFIAAPAILTNSSSVMALGTSNRFARAIDRARALSSLVEGKEQDSDPEIVLRLRQLRVAERRALILVR